MVYFNQIKNSTIYIKDNYLKLISFLIDGTV